MGTTCVTHRTSTKSLQFTASISIGMTEKTAVKFKAGIPEVAEVGPCLRLQLWLPLHATLVTPTVIPRVIRLWGQMARSGTLLTTARGTHYVR